MEANSPLGKLVDSECARYSVKYVKVDYVSETYFQGVAWDKLDLGGKMRHAYRVNEPRSYLIIRDACISHTDTSSIRTAA